MRCTTQFITGIVGQKTKAVAVLNQFQSRKKHGPKPIRKYKWHPKKIEHQDKTRAGGRQFPARNDQGSCTNTQVSHQAAMCCQGHKKLIKGTTAVSKKCISTFPTSQSYPLEQPRTPRTLSVAGTSSTIAARPSICWR